MDGDGTQAGYDLALIRAIADAVPVPVIASGGVGSLADLQALRDAVAGVGADAGAGVEGVIVGRALYDGSVGVADALRVLKGVQAGPP